MKSFPIFIDVTREPPLVVGDGALAAAKVRTLLLRAPLVTLASASPPACKELEELCASGRVSVLSRAVRESDIRGRPLVVAASTDRAVNERVFAMARAFGVPVNVPDRPELCTFTFGAVVDRGELTIAISTDGAAPVIATQLRAWIERELHPRIGRVAAIAREFREKVKRLVEAGSPRRQYWNDVLTGPASRAILDGDEDEGRRLFEARLDAAHLEVREGRIILVGAGPGDPELLTLKAMRAIKSADVILHDDLVGSGVLDLARREAELVAVGKRGGARSTPQGEINRLLVEHARAGRTVVRLKGGDPFVFGRAAEELKAAFDASIAVEVVPGITAAQACAADTLLPLTCRGEIRQLSLVTGAGMDGEPDLDWDALARPGQAMAVYMGIATALRFSARLIVNGAAPDTPVVIVENGSRHGRRAVATSLRDVAAAVHAKGIKGPAILLVGLNWEQAGICAPAFVETFSADAREAAASRTAGSSAAIRSTTHFDHTL